MQTTEPAGASDETGPSETTRGGSPAVAVVLFVGIVAAALILFLQADSGSLPVMRGSAAPDFELPQLDGGAPIVLSDFRDRVVLVNFWATWCKPCEEEIPAMERLYQELHPIGFELIAVSVDQNREDVEAFRARLAMTFPIALDPDQESSRQYQTTGFPESLLVGPDGRVVERYVGPRDWDHPSYSARIRELIEGGLPR